MLKNKILEEVDSPEKREKYRLEMCRLQDEANTFRKAIDRFDKGIDEVKRASILGKCYHEGYEWIRIDGFNDDYSPYGTKILEFSDPGVDRPVYQIETNTSIWEDDIVKSTQISNEEFLVKITEVLSYITSVINPIKNVISYERSSDSQVYGDGPGGQF
ncbi:MAG: hypothetical protein WC554_15410 [Clostridia bacterium]